MTVTLSVLLAAVTGLASLVAAYYGPWAAPIWRNRFRVVAGHDHLGPVLEGGYLLLTLFSLWLLARLLFPDYVREIVTTAGPGMMAFLTVLLALLALVAARQCLVAGPRAVARELGDRPDLADPRPGEAAGPEPMRAVRWAYAFYLPFSVVAATALPLLLVLSVAGLVDAWSPVEAAAERAETLALGAVPAAHATFVQRAAPGPDAPAGEGTRSAETGGGGPDAAAAGGAGAGDRAACDAVSLAPTRAGPYAAQARIAFEVYTDRLTDLARKYFGVLAVVLLLAMWVFGTPFQQVYTEPLVRLMRAAGLGVFLAIPVGIAVGAGQFFATAQTLHEPLREIMACVAMAPVPDPGSAALLETWQTFHADVSWSDYWSGLVANWGVVVLGAQVVLSSLQQRFGRTSVFENLLAPWTPYLTALLSPQGGRDAE